jgi:type IV pilus assembly protein PilC
MKLPFTRIISDRALSYFYRQLATMEESGIAPAAALSTVEDQFKSGEFRGLIGQLRLAAEEGRSISEEMEKYDFLFTPFQCSLVAAGETGGTLGDSYKRIADHLERLAQIRDRLVLAFLYPVVLLHIGVLILALVDFIQDGLGAALLSILYTLGVLYALIFVLIVVHGKFRNDVRYEELLLRIPWVGPVKKKLALMHFTRTLGALLASGVDVVTALDQAGTASGSPVIRKAGRRAAELVDGGRTLAEAFVASLLFPPIILQMMDVGERSGRIPDTMMKTAVVLEDEANHAIAILLRILPVAVSLVVFGFLALKIILFYAGILGGGTPNGF